MSDLFEIFKNIHNVKVIDSTIDYTGYIAIDLSESNSELSKINTTDATAFEEYCF
jgi:aspartate 1-decarboxylase